ncbi:hypothetical protein V5799_032715 [Amblyomma americanum]|uniref:Secreted protein n=1 Tax=Amblyomma americanum TaxID=6943 RepID=A0AAQ4DQD6_AMBAM
MKALLCFLGVLAALQFTERTHAVDSSITGYEKYRELTADLREVTEHPKTAQSPQHLQARGDLDASAKEAAEGFRRMKNALVDVWSQFRKHMDTVFQE